MRILVVEDDEDFRLSLVDLLVKQGLDVDSAGDAHSALEKLEGSDVMLTDLCLGGMDGMELCRLARTRHPGIEIIMMTGFDPGARRTEVTRRGARAFLAKPFKNGDLLECLHTIGSEMEERTQTPRLTRRASAGGMR